MNEQQERALTDGLRALAASTRGVSASPRVEAAVFAEFDRVTAVVPARAAAAGGAWLTIAAALTLACVSGIWMSQRASDRAVLPPQAGFTEVPGARFMPPLETASVVRVAVPVTALPSYGIAIVPDMTMDSVDLDLLIGQDGLARAVRLVVDTNNSRSTP